MSPAPERDPQIQPADPRERKLALLIVLGAAIGGTLLIAYLQSQREPMQDWLIANQGWLLAHPLQVAGVFFLAMLPLLGGCIYLWRFAKRIIEAEQFPPPGSRVTRPTQIRRGSSALWRARAIQTVVVLMTINCLLLPATIWYILRQLAAKA